MKHHASVVALVAAIASSAQTGLPQPRPPAARPVASGRAELRVAADFLAEQSSGEVKKAYQALFKAQREANAVPAALLSSESPRTVCGLTIWNVDADLDPRMRLTPPQPPDVTFAIQKITPPVCQQ